jgi:hypothetical protein
MTSLDDVAELAAGLAEVEESESRGQRTWSVVGRTFAWERAFSKADLRRYGDVPPPEGPILAVRVADLGEKEAVLSAGTRGVFTIPHFDNYPAVLVQLRTVSRKALRDLLLDGWLSAAPERLSAPYADPSADRSADLSAERSADR